MPTVYRKRWGFAPDPAVAREIAALDAQADCQRIVHLLTAYEFPWDITRALELALFYTYGSASVSTLLDRTQEFETQGQKRYDDTRLLVAHLMASGWDGDFGRRALQRMNRTHGHYSGRIPNEDFLFVLWTFIDFPLRWTNRWSRRPMTPHEQQAWLNFWLELGRRMGMQDVPADKPAFDAFVARYKAREFVPGHAASQRVAQATLRVMQGWLPAALHGLVPPVVYGFFADDAAFLAAVNGRPGLRLHRVVKPALRLLGWLKRGWAQGQYPFLVDSARDRTYPDHRYQIETLAPATLPPRAAPGPSQASTTALQAPARSEPQ